MSNEFSSRHGDPVRLDSPSGMSVQLNRHGGLRRMDHGDITVNLFLGSEIETGPTNLYLRRVDTGTEAIPLLGPRSPSRIHIEGTGLTAHGEWRNLRYCLRLVLARTAAAWLWQISLENTGDAAAPVDLVYAQDVALAHYGAVRNNEYYVSQYVDFTPLTHPRCGTVLAVRQNLSMGGRNPWAVIGSLGRGVSFATDALQFYGLGGRVGDSPAALRADALPGTRLQHEHAMAVIQDSCIRLEPGARVRRGFFGWLEAHHEAASSPADLGVVDRVLALPEATVVAPEPTVEGGVPVATTLFTACPVLPTIDLSEAELTDLFGRDWRAIEQDDGVLLSFFAGPNRHVVLRRKELRVLRPHGQIVRTGARLVPEEASLSATMWMSGTFNSLVTQGHVNINRFLSATHSYLGLLAADGQRLFIELPDGYHLLGVPSAFEMAPSDCRWLYKHATGLIEVRCWAPVDRHELRLSVDVMDGPPCRLLLSHHIALNGDDGADAVPALFESDASGVTIRPIAESDVGRRFPDGSFRIEAGPATPIEGVGGDELLFLDGRSRGLPFVTIVAAPARSFALRIVGQLIPVSPAVGAATGPVLHDKDRRTADAFWRNVTGSLALEPPAGSPLAGDVAHLQDILPWFTHDALIHYLAPHGLEQYSGGGWGTRDVCQGPVELLLALGLWQPLRDLLLRVFRQQNPDGDWPQWFMFFDRERTARPAESHGDIVFWPLLALGQYLQASEDPTLLDEVVPFFDDRGDEQAEKGTVRVHVERALQLIGRRMIPGTHLAAYGHGDWNDSLQPVDPTLSERLCSSWTVTLHHQMLTTLAAALRSAGRAEQAETLDAMARQVRADFQRLLIVDQTLAGFALFGPDGRIDYLLHPNDAVTGIRYRLLPMIHAIINGLFTPEQARAHVAHIAHHLLAADGARLFDRPVRYQGGPQQYFQRAESSSFFGREIGIMYTHAHLRYAESMARCGNAAALFTALRQANPVGLRTVVPAARLRQANCYYSSSDAAFADRYEAMARYDDVRRGTVGLEGGWRVYSSGAGIAVRLVRERFLGLGQHRSRLEIDPVIPAALDGLRTATIVAGRPLLTVYRVQGLGYGPTALTLNGTALPFTRLPNPYRTGGAAVAMATFSERLTTGANTLVVALA